MKSLAIVCPVYREEQVIGLFHATLRTAIADLSTDTAFASSTS